MSKKETLCSLFVLNLKRVTRQIARQILQPNKGNLIHFQSIEEVKYALALQEKNQISIQSDIPSHVYYQINPSLTEEVEDEGKEPAGDESADQQSADQHDDDFVVNEKPPEDEDADAEHKEVDEVIDADFEKETDELVDADSEDETDEVVAGDDEKEAAGISESDEKPEWYLSWEEVEDLSKTDLLKHFKEVDEVDLPTGKNAGQTKELAHQKLAELFEDHQPAAE